MESDKILNRSSVELIQSHDDSTSDESDGSDVGEPSRSSILYNQLPHSSNNSAEDHQEPTTKSEEETKLQQRATAIRNLVECEEVNVMGIRILEDLYEATAPECPKLDPAAIKAIFRNLEAVLDVSGALLFDLRIAASAVYSAKGRRFISSGRSSESVTSVEQSAADYDESLLRDDSWAKEQATSIGASFIKHFDHIKTAYISYEKGHERAMTVLAELSTDGFVQIWIAECNSTAQELHATPDIHILLASPGLCLTRYNTVLPELLSLTPKDHPDFASLEDATIKLKRLRGELDDEKKLMNRVKRIIE